MDERDFTDDFEDRGENDVISKDMFFQGQDEIEEREETAKSGKAKKVIMIVLIIFAVILVGVAAFAGYTVYQNDKPPVATIVHIESDNYNGHGIAEYGNMITLNVTFNKKLAVKPTITIQDKKVEVYGSGKSYYAKYFVQTQSADEEEVHFMIYDYKDEFRKVGSPVTVTTDLSRVTILGLRR